MRRSARPTGHRSITIRLLVMVLVGALAHAGLPVPASAEPRPGIPAPAGSPTAAPALPTGRPAAPQPKTVQPKTGRPKTGRPKTGRPKTGRPKTVQPKTGRPKTVQPTTSRPTAQAAAPATKAGSADRATKQVAPARALQPCASLGAPQGVTATAGGNAATATWRAPATGTPTAYLVSAVAAGRPAGAKVVAGSVLTATLTGLAAAVPHTLSVVALADCGAGPAAAAAPVTPTGAAATYAATVLADVPAAYYRLGEGVGPTVGADSSGRANLLAYGAAPTVGAAGALVGDPDTAVTLNGSCCAGTALPTLPDYGAARTLEAWVKPADTYYRRVAGWGDYSANGAFDVGTEEDAVVVNIATAELRFATPARLVGSTWHHLAVTYAAGVLTVYLDGLSLGAKTLEDPLDTPPGTNLVLGGGPIGGNPAYGGMDEVAVYPSALTAARVAAHFAAGGHARPTAPRAVNAQPGTDNELVVSWGTATVTGGPINRYVVTALVGGVPKNSVVVAGTKTAARVTGLSGGTAYTFRVVAGNEYGEGPPASSPGAVAATGPAVTYASTVLADLPRVYYRLGEPAGNVAGGDSSGNGRLLAYRPVAAFGVPGAIVGDTDRAATVNGSCCFGIARVALPANDAPRTVEAWVKPTDSSTRFFAGWGASEERGAFDVGTTGDSIVVNGYADDLAFSTPTSLVDGAWHHVAVSYSANTVTAYLDGLPVGSRAFREQLNTVSRGSFTVGVAHDGPGPYAGGLDEVAVYPAALSAARVAAHFAASGHARPGPVTGLTAAADVNRVRLAWTPPAVPDGIASYQVTALIGGVARNSVVVAGTVSTAVLSGLAGGTAYTVRVVATNRYGDGPAVVTPAAVTPTGGAGTYASAVLGTAPLVYYRLGEATGLRSAANSAGAGGLLTVRSTSHTWGAPGALPGDPDTAVTTDGGCCVGSSRTVMPRFDAARTVQAWVRPADGYPRWIAGWGSYGDGTAFNVGLRESTVVVGNGGQELSFATPRPLTDGVWHQVVVTYTAGTVTAYLDGIGLGGRTFPGRLNTTGTGLWVGAAADGGGPFYGGLDEVAVHPGALSAAQVAGLFTASGHGRPGQVGALSAVPQANAVSVSWNPPASTDGVTTYRVTALVAGVARNSLVVAGTAGTALLTGLAGGTAYTVRVVGGNAYGDGPAAATTTAVTPTGPATTYAATVLADAPNAYYRLGEGAGVPSGADSALGVPLVYGGGTRGQAGAVTGDPDPSVTADGGCCIGASATVPARFDAPRTLEAWVKPADGSARWVAGWGSSATAQTFNVGLADSRVLISTYNNDLAVPVGRSLVDGVWHHLVVTAVGGTATVYVDGVAVGARTFPSELDTGGGTGLRVGAGHDGGGAFYGGLDEVATYPSVLSAARVAAHFAASRHVRPAAVTALTVQARANALSVSWNAVPLADPVSHYLVTALVGGLPRNSVAVPGGALSATLTGLAGGTAHTVRVVAVNGYGSGAATTSAAAIPTGPAGTYVSTVLADAPRAYYRLGEARGMTTGADSAPGGVPLTYGGPATLGQSSAVVGDVDGSANGNSGCCIGASRSTTLPVYNAARTVEAWVRPADGYLRWVAGWGSSRTDRTFNVGLDAGRVVVMAYGDDLSFPIVRPLADTAWHHLAVTYSGASTTVYVDGLAIGTKAFTSTLNTVVPAGEGLRVGATHDGGGPFYGDLDEVAVYPVALSAARIAAHFAAGGHARPGAVTALTAVAQLNAVRVSWTAAPGGPARYLVTALRAGVARNAVVVAGTVGTATLTGLAGGTAYTVRVTATNTYGDGPAVTSAAATPTGTAATYAATVLADNPSAYYRLGEVTGTPVVADSAGGPLVDVGAAATLGSRGALGADLNTAAGTDGGCCLGVVRAAVAVNGEARTVEAWVKPSDASQRWLLGWGTSAVGRAFNVGVRGDGLLVSGYGDDLNFTAPSSLADGLWHHVVVVYSAGTATVYVDGVRLTSQAFSRPLNTMPTGTGLRLGAAHDGSSPFYGGVDEIAVYRSPLSAAQVLAHYRAGTT